MNNPYADSPLSEDVEDLNLGPVGRLESFSDWVQDMLFGDEEISLKGSGGVNSTSPPQVIENTEELVGTDEWPEDLPSIESTTDLTDDCPFTSGLTLTVFQTETHTGIWKATLTDGSELCIFRVPFIIDGDGLVKIFAGAAGDEDVIEDWKEIRDQVGSKGVELSPGLYKAHSGMQGVSLSEDPEISEVPFIHPKSEEFHDGMESFFEDPSPYAKYGQAGLKTWLIYGTFGTGKSTMIGEMARENKEDQAIVFVSNSAEMKAIGAIAAEQEVPTIIVVSEAEQVLNDSDGQTPSHESSSVGASSNTLNFLSGATQPQNPAGTAIVMVTNKPGRIPERIRKRTGRINELVKVGPISGDYAARCARLFLPEDNVVSDEAIKEVARDTGENDGLVGDDLREIAIESAQVAIEMGIDEINDECFREAARRLSESIREIEEFSIEDDDAHSFPGSDEGVGF